MQGKVGGRLPRADLPRQARADVVGGPAVRRRRRRRRPGLRRHATSRSRQVRTGNGYSVRPARVHDHAAQHRAACMAYDALRAQPEGVGRPDGRQDRRQHRAGGRHRDGARPVRVAQPPARPAAPRVHGQVPEEPQGRRSTTSTSTRCAEDSDGNLLVSGRVRSTPSTRSTAAPAASSGRLGGKGDDFGLRRPDRFAWQHDRPARSRRDDPDLRQRGPLRGSARARGFSSGTSPRRAARRTARVRAAVRAPGRPARRATQGNAPAACPTATRSSAGARRATSPRLTRAAAFPCSTARVAPRQRLLPRVPVPRGPAGPRSAPAPAVRDAGSGSRATVWALAGTERPRCARGRCSRAPRATPCASPAGSAGPPPHGLRDDGDVSSRRQPLVAMRAYDAAGNIVVTTSAPVKPSSGS